MNLKIEYNAPLQALNTLATPARAQAFFELRDSAELVPLLERARAEQLPVVPMGDGSNVVLGERVPGLVLRICTRGRERLQEQDRRVRIAVAAGENWHEFVHWCLQQGFHGLENLALIPGTVGAAPIQNIGAYGVEVGHFIHAVHCRHIDTGEAFSLDREACRFAYRDSIFKGELCDRAVVEQVDFDLLKKAAPVVDYPSLAGYLQAQGVSSASPGDVFQAVVAIRSSRLPDPARVPNAGSFFKNPVLDARGLEALRSKLPGLPHFPRPGGMHAVPAAYLIETSGVAGKLSGPVRLHPEHALVLINPERAGATEIRRIAGEIARAVKAQFGISLKQEPRDYG
jgi:UDP-N-acetylmuramate dehydrogenase